MCGFYNRVMLSEAGERPVNVLSNERYQVYSVWVEQRILPILLVLLLLTNIVRYTFLSHSIGHWADVILVRQVSMLVYRVEIIHKRKI